MMGLDLRASRPTVVVYLDSEGWREKEGPQNPRTLGRLLHACPRPGEPGEVSCVRENLSSADISSYYRCHYFPGQVADLRDGG